MELQVNANLSQCWLSPTQFNQEFCHQQELVNYEQFLNMLLSANGSYAQKSFEQIQEILSLNQDHSIRKLKEFGLQVLYKLRFMFYFVWPSETMFSSFDQVPRYVTEMFPIFFLMAILENIIRLFQGRSSLRMNETIGSLSQGIFQECLRIKVRSVELLIYCLVYENFRLVTLPWNSLWSWWLCYLSVDLGFYFAHRLAHEVNFIWAIHQAHHSSEEFSLVSALRQALLQPFTAWFTYVPLALAIPPQLFLAHLQLSELYMAWLHTEVVDKIGPLEYILNTPSHHRVHHSRNPEYIDKNYGGMLIIWDRLFGTFKAEEKLANPPVYGLVHPVRSFNPLWVQFHSWPLICNRWRRAKSLQDKLGVLFKGPGWRPGLRERLGKPQELPKINFPVQHYNPQLPPWLNGYILLHFGMLVFLYHGITLYHKSFSPLTSNLGVLSLIGSITSLGILLDDKRRYCNLYELIRCACFFLARRQINFIIGYSLQLSGFPTSLISLLISGLHLVFASSLLVNAVILIWRHFQPGLSRPGAAACQERMERAN